MDINIPEELLSVMLLKSLSDDLENFVVAIESRDVLPPFRILINKLLEEYERRSSRRDMDAVQQQLLMSKSESDKDKKPLRHNKKCYVCGIYIYKKQVHNSAMLHGMQAQGLLQNDWVFGIGSTSHICCVKEISIS